jgi:hypothetical protein
MQGRELAGKSSPRECDEATFYQASVRLCAMLMLLMHASTILWIVGGTFIIVVVAIIAFVRRSRPSDLGSVSIKWTTEHSIGYRGGDGSSS